LNLTFDIPSLRSGIVKSSLFNSLHFPSGRPVEEIMGRSFGKNSRFGGMAVFPKAITVLGPLLIQRLIHRDQVHVINHVLVLLQNFRFITQRSS
jgi:hypothetical protein